MSNKVLGAVMFLLLLGCFGETTNADDLIQAVKSGNTSLAYQLIKQGIDVREKDPHNRTALWWAVLRGDLKLSKSIMDKGVSLSERDSFGQSILLAAVISGSKATTKLVLKSIYDRKDLDTALQIAARLGHTDVVQTLIDSGADVNSKDVYGRSPLLNSVWIDSPAVFRVLQSFDLSSQSGVDGRFVLIRMIHRNTIYKLVENGAEITDEILRQTINVRENDLLNYFLTHRDPNIPLNPSLLDEALLRNRQDLVFTLLQAGISVNFESSNCMNATHRALSMNDAFILKMILEAGAEVDARDEMGETALMKLGESSQDLIQVLIEFGADVNAEDFYDRSLLQKKFSMDEQMINALLDKNFSIGKSTNEIDRVKGIVAIDSNVARLLIDAGADTSGLVEWAALLKACINGDLDTIKNWKPGRFNLNSQNWEGKSALIIALENEQQQAAKLLIELGADVNNENSDYGPLCIAAQLKMPEIVQLLLGHGAEKSQNDALMAAIWNQDESMALMLIRNGIYVEDDEDREPSPLFEASQKGMLNVVKALIKAGANVNWIGRWEDNALMEATFRGYAGIVRVLVEAGADPTLVNSRGESALSIAQEHGNEEIIKFLESKQ